MSELVVVTVPLPDDVLDVLAAKFDLQVWRESSQIPEEVLKEWIAPARGLLCSVGTPVTRSVMESAPALKMISTISVGVDHIDVSHAAKRGIPVGYTPDILVDSTADMALALMLAVTRRVPEADQLIRNGGWQAGWSTGFFSGHRLKPRYRRCYWIGAHRASRCQEASRFRESRTGVEQNAA